MDKFSKEIQIPCSYLRQSMFFPKDPEYILSTSNIIQPKELIDKICKHPYIDNNVDDKEEKN
jgi:hypothetical protein